MSLTISQLRNWGRSELKAVESDRKIAALEADVLLSHSAGLDQAGLIAHGGDPVDPQVYRDYQSCIKRRLNREPIAYITGVKEFYSLEFMVTPAVLIPRPETELVVERVLKLLGSITAPACVVDIGTGSGAIALSLLYEIRKAGRNSDLTFIAADISEQAIDVARNNAESLGLEQEVSFVVSDLLTDVDIPSRVQEVLLLSNPPYVADSEFLERDIADFEPLSALRAGEEGLDIIRQLIVQAAAVDAAGVSLVMEIGESQGDKVHSLLDNSGFTDINLHGDLWGRPRVVEAVKSRA